MVEVITGILTIATLSGGVLVFAALGEVMCERVGVVNLGIEGIMSLGAVSAVIAGGRDGSMAGLATALAVGALLGVIYAFATVVAKANQILCGLAFTFLGLGLSAWIGAPYSGQPLPAHFEPIAIPILSTLPVVGPAFFDQNILAYVGYLLLPSAFSFLLYNTRHGINLRAVGEHPAAADAAGVPVTTIRFFYVVIGAILAATSGAYLTLAFIPSWSEGMTAGRGWIALALVIFARYSPWKTVAGALFFGVITSFGFVAQVRNWGLPASFFSMLPYLGTIAVMLLPLLQGKRLHKRWIAPAALGTAYFRDERY
jgi:general nucleoside transport system permease protein